MQRFVTFLNWVGETSMATAISESTWLFPVIEVVHVFAICLVFGTIAIIDLRLLGLASAKHRYTQLAQELLPWTWGAWVVAAIVGTLLLATRPLAYFENTDFRLKFLCMGLAAVNMLVFQFVTSRSVVQWDTGRAPWAGRIAGGLSLVLWIGVVYFGRKTGFTLVQVGA